MPAKKQMPSQSGIKNKKKKQRNNKSGNGQRPKRMQVNELVEPQMPGFRSLHYRTKLTYYDTFTVSTGAGSAGTYIFSTNGAYDPNITGTGHQPMAFDQLMLSFEHYVVTRSKLTVSFKATSTTNTTCVAISLNASTTPVTAYSTLLENGIIVKDRLGMYPYEGAVKSLSMPCNVARFGDVTDLLDNPYYEGSVASNPTEQSYYHVSAWNPDSVSSIDVLCEAFIEFDITFREPRKNSPSVQAALKRLVLAEEKTKSG